MRCVVEIFFIYFVLFSFSPLPPPTPQRHAPFFSNQSTTLTKKQKVTNISFSNSSKKIRKKKKVIRFLFPCLHSPPPKKKDLKKHCLESKLVRNNFLDRRRGKEPLGPQRRLPGLRPDEHERRQALDLEARRDRLVGVDVDLDYLHFVAELGRDGLELLGHQHAGAAPRREEVDDEGPVSRGDAGLEAVGVELLDLFFCFSFYDDVGIGRGCCRVEEREEKK